MWVFFFLLSYCKAVGLNCKAVGLNNIPNTFGISAAKLNKIKKREPFLHHFNAHSQQQQCRSFLATYLQYDGRSRLELQHAGHAERFKLRVGVVDEVGVVEGHQRLNVIQLEAKLVGSLGDLLVSGQTDGQLGRLAQHGRLTDDLTQLDDNRGRDEAGGTDERTWLLWIN